MRPVRDFTGRISLLKAVPIAGAPFRTDAEGMTRGCGTSPRIFGPANNVTRAEMAVLLLRAKHGALFILAFEATSPLCGRSPAGCCPSPWWDLAQVVWDRNPECIGRITFVTYRPWRVPLQ
jgi:hypothetical protein